MECPKCQANLIQDTDSWTHGLAQPLWPFFTMGWPNQTADLEDFILQIFSYWI